MSTERPTRSDKELWRSLATDPGERGSVSDLDFAAWLEGRLPEAAAARIEAAVAADPGMRRAALELAEVMGRPLPMPPARLEVRAKALVGFDVDGRGARASLFDWLFASGSRFALQRAATFAAAVIIAISGFMLGGGLGASMAQDVSASQTDTANELSEFLLPDGN